MVKLIMHASCQIESSTMCKLVYSVMHVYAMVVWDMEDLVVYTASCCVCAGPLNIFGSAVLC